MQTTVNHAILPEALQWRLDRLNRTLNALLEELSRIDEARLNRVPASGQWSPIQVMHHLLIAEEQSLGYLRKKLSHQPVSLPFIGWRSRWRTFLLWLYLRSPFKFKAPAGVGDEVLPAEATLAETEARWRKLRQDLTDFLANLPADLYAKEVYRHPFAGRMALTSMLDFFYWHFIRHYQQIMRTLAA